MSKPVIAKSGSSTSRGGRFVGCAGKVVARTLGGLCCVRRGWTEGVKMHPIAAQKSAEGIVVDNVDEGPND